MEFQKAFTMMSIRAVKMLSLGLLLLLSGCSSMSYFWQAAAGHVDVLNRAKPIDDFLADPSTDERLKQQLLYVKDIRQFSVDVLHLPDNSSYRTYADLQRPFVVWNVVAAPEDSLKLQTWCFPVLGCISYKGFYSENAALDLASTLRAEGKEVAVMGIPAYSTLGFTSDPVLNSFIYYPAGELARLVFHELAHQVVYIPDDTPFNESFATAVEELGVQLWLAMPGREQLRANYLAFDSKRQAFRALMATAHSDLNALFLNEGGLPRSEILKLKQARYERLKVDYEALKISWGGWSGYDRFMDKDLNNAKLGVFGAYSLQVPAFKALFECSGHDFERFYSEVEKLGGLSAEERSLRLAELMSINGSTASDTCFKYWLAR